MERNPILREKKQQQFLSTSGLEEVNQNIEFIENLSGGNNVWVTILQGVVGCVASWAVGNKGKVCTWTVECQKNCS
ncbi:plantaricin C family lantibiotic [Vagococcus fluvialis]|uniref:Vagococcin T vcnA1 peptide n=1 Tax=Vagococcus fluvialis TaxID=2738 RepID=A0A979HLS5_9ENTE|nr:plantaricin C family lantibiotic [Vagococcus fluvialis]MCM2139855.1 plantaricin C family lantibiotic [Vagococcus fluvialis]URZ88908.1 vagococcin T vcnA1 peptide [Vagococcus fluvialis]